METRTENQIERKVEHQKAIHIFVEFSRKEIKKIEYIEELDEKRWNEIIKQIAASKDENSIPNEVKTLLNQVQRVFDPKGILV